MTLENYVAKLRNISADTNTHLQEVIDLVEMQDFKRVYRGGESDLALSCEVVERYLKSGKTYEGLLNQLNRKK